MPAIILLILLCVMEYETKKTMTCLETNMKALDAQDQKTFKKKREEMLEVSNDIHRLGYSIMANDKRGNDDEFLRFTGDLIGFNRKLKNSILMNDYKSFERNRKSVRNSCTQCHKVYRKDP